MTEAYPEPRKTTSAYAKRLTTLKNRLSKGRNWHKLAKQFGTYILALMLVEGDFNIHDRE
jgi:hypothetical protein